MSNEIRSGNLEFPDQVNNNTREKIPRQVSGVQPDQIYEEDKGWKRTHGLWGLWVPDIVESIGPSGPDMEKYGWDADESSCDSRWSNLVKSASQSRVLKAAAALSALSLGANYLLENTHSAEALTVVPVQTGDFEVINKGGVELTRIYGDNDPDNRTFVQIFLQKNATKQLAKDIVNYFFLVDPMPQYVNDFTFLLRTSSTPDLGCDRAGNCNIQAVKDLIDATHNATGIFSLETIVLIDNGDGAVNGRVSPELYPDQPSIHTYAAIVMTPNPPDRFKTTVDEEIAKSVFGFTDLWMYPVTNQNIGRGYANCSREPWVFGWSITPWKGCFIDENAYRSDDETLLRNSNVSHFGAWESTWMGRVMELGPAKYWYPRFKVSLNKDNPAPGKGFPQGSLDLGIKLDIPYGVKNVVIEATPAPDKETGKINSPGLGPIQITNQAEIARIRKEGYILPAPKLGVGPYVSLPDMTYTWRVRVSPDPDLPPEDVPGWKTVQVSPVKTISNEAGIVKDHSAPRGAEKIVFPVLRGGETTNNLTPTLRWVDGNTDVFYYEVQLSKDPTFNTNPDTATAAVQWNLVHGGQTNPLNSYKAAPLELGKTYYWRVRPRVQGDGKPSEWGSIGSFKTSTDARILQETDWEAMQKDHWSAIVQQLTP